MNSTLNENRNHTIRVLAVSEDQAVLGMLLAMEESGRWQLETAASGWDAMERVQAGAAPHLFLLDLPRGDSNSLHFLRWMHRLKRDLPVVLLCHAGEAAEGKEAARPVAGELLVRPFDETQLEFVMMRHLAPRLSRVPEAANRNMEALGPDGFFVSASLIMQKLRAQAALLAKTDVPVLITGERGAGKYTVARLIHQLSVRSGFRLTRINCEETPESVLEAELFGLRRGALGQGSLGKFSRGESGTIFLDEIAALSAGLQSRLLQVLQEQEMNHEDATPAAAVRILAASSANLDRALSDKRLREDLYYRLSAFTVNVPPLRQRPDEIAILMRYFMHRLAKYYGLPPRVFSVQAIEACQRYGWPGNLKELETFVKRYLAAGDEVSALRELGISVNFRGHPAREVTDWDAGAPEADASQEKSRVESLKSLIQGIKSEAEQNAIGVALRKTGWNRKAAARLLSVSYRTLLYKIEQYNMRAPESFLAPVETVEFSVYDEVKGDGKAS
jgi:two-component system response regulator AtoC